MAWHGVWYAMVYVKYSREIYTTTTTVTVVGEPGQGQSPLSRTVARAVTGSGSRFSARGRMRYNTKRVFFFVVGSVLVEVRRG